jgi:hypothetical protein
MRTPFYLAAVLLCAPAFSSPGHPRGSDELLAVLPEETLAFLSLHDLEAMRASAGENAWFRFFQDEQMRPWIERLKDAMNQDGKTESEPGESAEAGTPSSPEPSDGKEAPFDIEEFVASIHGSVVAFFVPVSEQSEPGFGLLVEPGEDRAEFDGFYDLARSGFADSMVASEADYKEVGLELFESTDGGAWNTLACFETDGTVALVGSFGRENALELAQGMIDRIKKADEAPTLLDRSELAEARKASGPMRHAEVFVDIPAFLKVVAATEEIPKGNEKVMQLLGLRDVRWLHMSAGLGQGEELDLRINVHIPDRGYLSDWVGLLGPWPRALAKLLPVESSSLSFVRFDVFGFYQSVFKLFEAVEPRQHAAVKGQIDALGQAYGIDLEGDLLRQFTGEFASFNIEVPEGEATSMFEGWSGDVPVPSDLNLGSATIVGLQDSDAVEIFIDEVLSIFGADEMVEDEIFQGQVVYKLNTGTPFTLYWSYLDAGMVISPYPTALRSVLRRIGSEDAADALSNEKLAAPLAKVADAPVVTVTDTRVQLRTMLAAASALRDMFDGLDLSSGKLGELKLPDASVADKYFHGALLFALEKGDNSLGLRFSSF